MPPATTSISSSNFADVSFKSDSPADDHVPSNEFFVQAELWMSGAKSNALTFRSKVSNTGLRKKAEKDKTGANETHAHTLDGRRVKERSSWLSVPGAKGAGQWRQVTCKLVEDDDHATLNIILEDAVVYSILVHTMNTTEIRLADRSLFNRPDCLGLHCKPGNGTQSTGILSPLYLGFASTDALNTWTALLRSYAVPEVYGRRVNPHQGGLYRMWRQVELQVVQGRNLGTAQLVGAAGFSNGHSGMNGDLDDPLSSTGSVAGAEEMDLYCEIVLEPELGHPAARTSVKRAGGGNNEPYWHETFTMGDLPPFGPLAVQVWREKRGPLPLQVAGPALVGGVEIALNNFRRGEYVEGWYPVLLGGAAANGIQVGEVKLKIRIDEEIVLPAESYAKLLQTISMRNYLDALADLEKKLKVEHAAQHIVPLAVAQGVLLTDIFSLAEREVNGSGSPHTLFRGNTVLTKTMELAMSWYGKTFLDRSVGPVVRRMIAERAAIEVDPVRLGLTATGGKGASVKDLEQNVRQLVFWCQEFWNQIWQVRGECPNELRKLFEHIRKLVENNYKSDSAELRWQCVSAFCFLRFIVPAILHPHLFGLCQGLPPPQVQRSLTLVAKVIQSLANLNQNVQKEEFMRGVKDFVTNNLAAMIDYIVVVSNPVPDQYVTPPVAGSLEPRDRSHIYDSLHERLPTLPLLYRESVPLLPHLLDVPKHLATLASAIVRSQQRPSTANGGRPSTADAARKEPEIKRLIDLAMQVETTALHAVGRLAPKPKLSIAPPQSPPHPSPRRPSSSGTAVGSSSRRPGSSGRQLNSAGPTQSRFTPSDVGNVTAQTLPNPSGLGRPSRHHPNSSLKGLMYDDSEDSPPTSPTVFFLRKGMQADDDDVPSYSEREQSDNPAARARKASKPSAVPVAAPAPAVPPVRPRMRRPNTAPSTTTPSAGEFVAHRNLPPAAVDFDGYPLPSPRGPSSPGPRVSIDVPSREHLRPRVSSATSRPPTAPTPGGSVRAFGRSESELLRTPLSPNGGTGRYDRFERREAGVYGGYDLASGSSHEDREVRDRSHARVASSGGTVAPESKQRRGGFLRGLLGGSRR